MTGGTILLRKNYTYFLTKVAHDGYDLEDLAEKISKEDKYYLDPKKILVDYLRGRGGVDFEPIDVMTDDVDKCIYEKKLKERDFWSALEKLEEELCELTDNDENMEDEHPYMQLSCGYTDYVLFVDCNTGMVSLNDELYEDYKKNTEAKTLETSSKCNDDCSCGHSHNHEDAHVSEDEGAEELKEEEKKDELGTANMQASDFLFDVCQLKLPNLTVSAISIVPKSYFEENGCLYDGHMVLDHIIPSEFEYSSPGEFLCSKPLDEVKKELLDRGLQESKEFTDWLMDIYGANKTQHERLMEEHKRPNQDEIDAMWKDFTVPGEPNDASDFFAQMRAAKNKVS